MLFLVSCLAARLITSMGSQHHEVITQSRELDLRTLVRRMPGAVQSRPTLYERTRAGGFCRWSGAKGSRQVVTQVISVASHRPKSLKT